MVTVSHKDHHDVEAMTPFQEEIRNSKKVIKSFKAKADKHRSISERYADVMTETFGSIHFLILNISFFIGWILININLFPQIKPFDPFPFVLLTTAVSLEAIFLAIFVLISQNRQVKVDELREEVAYQIDLISEKEVTKILALTAKIAEKNGIDISKDEVLAEMLQPTDTERIEKALEKQMDTKDPIIPLKLKLPTDLLKV